MSSRYSNDTIENLISGYKKNDVEHYKQKYNSLDSEIEHFSVKKYGYPISIVFLFVVVGVLGYLLYSCKNPMPAP